MRCFLIPKHQNQNKKSSCDTFLNSIDCHFKFCFNSFKNLPSRGHHFLPSLFLHQRDLQNPIELYTYIESSKCYLVSTRDFTLNTILNKNRSDNIQSKYLLGKSNYKFCGKGCVSVFKSALVK